MGFLRYEFAIGGFIFGVANFWNFMVLYIYVSMI